MNIDKIIIPEVFTPPGVNKMVLSRVHYLQFHCLRSKIIVSANNVLLDGYTSYLIAKENGLEDVPVEVSYLETITGMHKGCKKLYEWKVPKELQGQMEVGSSVMVDSRKGKQWVEVVGIQRHDDIKHNMPMRSVVGKAV